MSDGMGREPAYLSSHATNRYFIPNWGSIYDTDGLEGLYVPKSSFSETAKDIVSGTVSQNMNINDGSSTSSTGKWGMQALQNAYQKAANALSKNIRKNKVKVKYGTQVFLVNSREKRK